MIMNKSNYKNTFISAYMYCYGATKRDAEKAYKNANIEYIRAIIESLKNDAKSAFYND